MAISAIGVTTDRTHYSRYDRRAEVVTAKIVASGGAVNDVIQVTLARETIAGERTLSTVSKTLSAQDVNEGYATVTFNLRALVDADGYMLARCSARRDDYSVRATAGDVSGVVYFSVLPATVDDIKARFLMGLPLTTAEQLSVVLQPRVITGVTVKAVSAESATGRRPLVLTVAGGGTKTLAWGGGVAETIGPGKATYILMDSTTGYITVEVDAALLPGTSQTETLVVDLGQMSEGTIIDQVIDVLNDVIDFMQMPLEPTIIVSRLLADPSVNPDAPTTYDEVREGVTYHKPWDRGRWISVKLPVHGLLRVDLVEGWFNRGRAITMSKDWISFNGKSGLVEFVPSTSVTVNWLLYGTGFYAFIGTYETVPQFWQYKVLAGLREMPDVFRDFIAKRAAMHLLTIAGNARYAAGVTSLSISRDGISENQSIAPGVYSAAAEAFARDTGLVQGPNGTKEATLERLRQRYRGVAMVTV